MKYTFYSIDLSHQLDAEKIVYLAVDDKRIAEKMKQDWSIFETEEQAQRALVEIKALLKEFHKKNV